jgi:hypothetical protein
MSDIAYPVDIIIEPAVKAPRSHFLSRAVKGALCPR